MKLKTLVIDDEPLAREGMVGYVEQVSFLELVQACEHPLEAMETLSQGGIDLLLLDIQMPHLSGIEFLKSLSQPPLTIFTTAYPSYALEGYQLEILDYLVKPITFPRFMQAVQKALRQHQLLYPSSGAPEPQTDAADHFFVKCDNQYEKILYEDILFVEALQNYVSIYTTAQKYTALLTLKAVEESLPASQFMRVHRSYLVSIEKVQSLRGHELLIDAFRVPVSRAHREAVHERIVQDRLLGG